MRFAFIVPFVLIAAVTNSAAAKDKKALQPAPEAFQKVIDCRSISVSADRLSCYDTQVAALEQAKVAGDLVVTDKAAVKEARKGLFGFKLPSLKIFGGDEEDDALNEIETTIASVSSFGYGSWRITLPDGAVWEQNDTTRLVFDPKSGDKIKIKEAAFGSFKANIDGQPAIKVKRVQ